MKSKYKENSSLSVMEAIATLSTIAHFDVETLAEDLQNEEIQHFTQSDTQRHFKWLNSSAKGKDRIREIFSVILDYLRQFYQSEHSYLTDPQTLEGIKNIMSLVGDAAKKIDKYANLFNAKTSVTQLKEYKQLNEFYRSRIAHQIDEGVLGKWILAISKNTLARQQQLVEEQEAIKATAISEAPRHLFVNLEVVKKDTEYELFFIRKEDGSLFFSPRLLRNIKLICDFSGAEHLKDPLVDIPIWFDLQMHNAAKTIAHEAHDLIEQFYHDAFKFRHRELVAIVHKCLMALLLSSNSRNLLREIEPQGESHKTCYAYFQDFILYLREALHTSDYHKLMTYTNEQTHDLNHLLLELIHHLCHGLYLSLHRFEDFSVAWDELIRLAHEHEKDQSVKAISSKNSLCKTIENDYHTLTKLFKYHSRGPLSKILTVLQDGYSHVFEPFAQLNIPSQLYALNIRGHKIVNLHLPSPTYQEYIHRVNVLDEFKGFLRHCYSEFPHHKHLLINLQDRTSWREYSRCLALEDLRLQDIFNKSLTVVTLAKDTEFYHQLASYERDNHVNSFLKCFKAQLEDENSGYHFPSNIKASILSHFADGVFSAIHRIFFSKKNTLSREHRLDFIEIFNLFLTLKILDVVKPNSFSLTCKDGADIAPSSNSLIYIFLQLMGKEPINEATWGEYNRIFYAPAILTRERLPLKERFDRMLGALKAIEFVYHDLGHDVFKKVIQEAFGHFYKNSIFDATVV